MKPIHLRKKNLWDIIGPMDTVAVIRAQQEVPTEPEDVYMSSTKGRLT